MKNEYWLIPAPLLQGVKQRAVKNSKYPHENVHWALSNDKKKAIVQGDFDDKLIKWLNNQPLAGVRKLGNYNKGKADKSVHDFIKANEDDWASLAIR